MSRFSFRIADKELQKFDKTIYQLVDKKDRTSPLNNVVGLERRILDYVKYLNREFGNVCFDVRELNYLQIKEKVDKLGWEYTLSVSSINDTITICFNHEDLKVVDLLSEEFDINRDAISVAYVCSHTIAVINLLKVE